MVYDGTASVTTAGTRVALSTTSQKAAWIIFKPKAANTNPVFIGGSTVSATSGYILTNGNNSVTFPPVADLNGYDLSKIFIDATTNGEGVQFTYFTR